MVAKNPQKDTAQTNVRNQKRIQSLTCQVLQTELAQAEVSVTSVVEEDCKGVAVFIQLGSADDPQVLQRQVVKLVQGNQHIACHFADRLWTELWRKMLVRFNST